MDFSNLSAQDASKLFEAMMRSDDGLLDALARAAIASSAQMHEDMFLDLAYGDPLPDGNDVRLSAQQYVDDSLNDFLRNIKHAIACVPVDIQAKASIKITVK